MLSLPPLFFLRNCKWKVINDDTLCTEICLLFRLRCTTQNPNWTRKLWKKWEKSPNQAWIIFRSTSCREKSNYTPTNPKDNSDDIKDFSPYKFLRYRSVKTAQKPQQKKNLFCLLFIIGKISYLNVVLFSFFFFSDQKFTSNKSPPPR